MAIDRKLWQDSFVEKQLPTLPCARCTKGELSIDQIHTSIPTHWDVQNEEGWEPEWIKKRFIAFAKCGATACGEIVCISGSTTTHGGIDEESGNLEYYTTHHVASMVPGPKIIQLPVETPETVEKEIEKAFELFWSDPGSCANRLRVSVERLLDHCKVKKLYIEKGKKQRAYSLNDRIGMFKKEEDLLHALRVIGNLGSHGTATRRALLDAFDIYHDVLQAVLSTRKVSVTALAKKIKKTKGHY